MSPEENGVFATNNLSANFFQGQLQICGLTDLFFLFWTCNCSLNVSSRDFERLIVPEAGGASTKYFFTPLLTSAVKINDGDVELLSWFLIILLFLSSSSSASSRAVIKLTSGFYLLWKSREKASYGASHCVTSNRLSPLRDARADKNNSGSLKEPFHFLDRVILI